MFFRDIYTPIQISVAPKFALKCITGNPMVVSSESRYLSSYNADHNSIGSNRCPWRIQVKPGIYILNYREVQLMSYNNIMNC